jgi:hypothetical protein
MVQSSVKSISSMRPFNWTQQRTSGGNAAMAAMAGTLAFVFGKPRSGACVMVNPAIIQTADLVKRGGNGSIAQYFRPDDDDRWLIPAVRMKLTSTALVPAVTMEAQPRGLVIPFVESWAGAAPVLEQLSDPATRAIFYAYTRGIGDGSVGGYMCRSIPVEEPWATVYSSLKWPTPPEIWAALPVVSFARMAVEDHAFAVLAQEATGATR